MGFEGEELRKKLGRSFLPTISPPLGLSSWSSNLLARARAGNEGFREHPSIRKQESEADDHRRTQRRTSESDPTEIFSGSVYAYDPMLVSIGPLYHGDNKLLPMQDIKLRYVESLIHRSPKNSIRNYIKAIHMCEDRARKQYSEKFNWSREEFVSMLVLDGCFIIEYFLRRALNEGQEFHPPAQGPDVVGEPDISFFVLVKLFEMTNNSGNSATQGTFLDLALDFLRMKLIPDSKLLKEGKVHHLLYLQHKCLNPHGPRDKHRSNGQMTTNYLSRLFYGLLYLVFIHELPPYTYSAESDKQFTIPSTIELQGFRSRVQEEGVPVG
ncbi:hypothetical protein Taro_026173 [Colocasia esculenta]|uniref:Uncharacterized protein n=1 Tax=Colocasia esculenta TaxID=4460 RepID=A0A843VEH0_COLES|nr:hypothetical protein [Colocasia esculenta]